VLFSRLPINDEHVAARGPAKAGFSFLCRGRFQAGYPWRGMPIFFNRIGRAQYGGIMNQ
jgi:hypothetical protein